MEDYRATLVMSSTAILALVSILSPLFGPHNLLSMCSFSWATVRDAVAIAEWLYGTEESIRYIYYTVYCVLYGAEADV